MAAGVAADRACRDLRTIQYMYPPSDATMANGIDIMNTMLQNQPLSIFWPASLPSAMPEPHVGQA